MQTATALITDACQICKAPGFTAQAGRYLNTILSDLAQNYDFPAARQTTSLSITANGGNGTGNASAAANQWYKLTLPSSVTYLRTKEVFYNVLGVVYFLNQLSLPDFDRLFQGSGINNYPYWYTVNVEFTPPEMAFYPPPNLPQTLTIRTQYLPADITTPETSSSVPWFPNQRFLKTRLCADLMMLTGDQRRSQFDADANAMLTDYTKMVDDKENYAQTVRRDPLAFRSLNRLKPTKQTGF